MKINLSLVLLGLTPFFCEAQVTAPKPYGVLPSERQLKWHEMEMYCLIHYTPTTFQDKEWGYGDADPKIFNPSRFDAQQIADAALAGGFKGLISVAKHHDGFCLWPTATTEYSVASSPWKNGKGDMVKDFMEASRKNDMAFGIYLSAWDRNDARYGTPAYAEAYRIQLKELMSNYGTLFTSWHDGANGGDGYYGGLNEERIIDRANYYGWEDKTWPIVRELQPMAMIFSDVGPDMRWVGNEHGFAGETSWATFSPVGIDGRKPVPGDSDYSQSPYGTRNGDFWIPAECDVPLRPGWFYHEKQDGKVKNPNELFEIYLKSVGRGANMNLGLAPMPEGYLHANDVKSLEYFGRKLKTTFAKNLVDDAVATASSIRGNNEEFFVQNIFDDDRYSYYAPEDGVFECSIEINLSGEKEFDLIRLRENIKLGQRLDSVQVEVYVGNEWKMLTAVTSIGANRLIKLVQPVVTNRLRLNLFAPVEPTLSDFALFKEYNESFSFDNEVQNEKNRLSNTKYGLLNAGKTVITDNNSNSSGSFNTKDLIFELKEPVSAMGYLPRQDNKLDGMILKYELLVSDNNRDWSLIKEGEFSNVKSNPVEQIIDFGNTLNYKYYKLIAKELVGEKLTGAEVYFYN